MSTDVDYDELEALLAGLEEPEVAAPEPEPEPIVEAVVEAGPDYEDGPEVEGREERTAKSEPVAEVPSAGPIAEEPAKRTRRTKKEMEAARAAETAAAVIEVEPEPVVVEEEFDEVEALIAAAEPTVAPAAKLEERYEEAFEEFSPESNLKTFIKAEQLQADLDFSQLSLSNAQMRQASLFAHYSMLAHQAQFQADRAYQQVDLLEAQLDQKYRDAFTTSGTKVTENVIKSAIIKDERYQAAMLRKHEAKAIAEMVKSASDSFRHRRDMISVMSYDTREERKGEMRTMAVSESRKEAQNTALELMKGSR